MSMDVLLKEIEDIIPHLRWRRDGTWEMSPAVKRYAPRCFIGVGQGWRVVVTDFDISAQGFPEGTRGCDGAAVKGSVLVHLPRDLAERAFSIAMETMS